MRITAMQATKFMDAIIENYINAIASLLDQLNLDAEKLLVANSGNLANFVRQDLIQYCDILGITEVEED